MQKFFSSLFLQFTEFYKSLSPMRKMAIMLSGFVVLASVGMVSFMVSKRSFVPLLKNVPPDQLAVVISKLKEKNIPFAMDESGSSVLIPSEFLPATQMAIMSEAGSNRIGNIGMELFDKQDFGTTSYTQKVNFQRALQGELVRAINTLDVVKQSKVMLALPPKKTFLEEGGVPKASVVVDLHAGKNLSPEQVRGIMYLVSSAVENLEADNVTVVDSAGRVLSKPQSGDHGQTDEMADFKQKTEHQFEERIESILAKVVGDGKVIARVSASLDRRNISSIEETVDPEKTALKSQQSTEEKLVGDRTSPTGVPGSRANVPGAGADAAQNSFKQDVNKENKVSTYEVPKTVRNIREAPGRIDKLSIAILVDGNLVETKKPDGTTESKWQPRSPEELQRFESLVKNSVGFDEKRGDMIKVENIQFKAEDFSESSDLLSKLERRKMITYLIKVLGILLAFGFFFLAVIRPFIRWVSESFQESVDNILPRTIEELEELQGIDATLPGMASALPMMEESLDPDKAESELLKDRIMGLMEKDSKKAASALGLWLVRKEI